MENKHTIFLDALKQRLAQPLPGADAQQKMASYIRQGEGIKVIPNSKTRRSAVLILLYPYAKDIYFPLMLRPDYDGVHAGQVGIPGGRFEPTDRNLVHTALREAQEEIGIKASDVEVLGLLTQLYIPPSNYLVQPVVGFLPYHPEFFPDPHEVAEIIEVSLSTLTDKSIIGSKELFVRNVILQAPYYNVHGHTVWGATAMMLSEFLMILEGVVLRE